MKTGRDITVERIGSSTVFIGSTSRGIRRQHFREKSDQLEFSSEIDLAKAVVANGVTERWGDIEALLRGQKNPVLSGLSCFTAGSERSAVAEDNERQDLKCAKRSINQRNQLQAEDKNCSSSAWEWNREHAVEFQASSVDDHSVISMSLVVVEVLGKVRK